MKFIVDPAIKAASDTEIKVGDVYPSKGGPRTRIAMWVVCGVTDSIHMLGLNPEGDVVSAVSYATHAMIRRKRIGFVNGLDQLEFKVESMP